MTPETSIDVAIRGEPYGAPYDRPLSLELALTKLYRSLGTAPKARREAEFLKLQIPAMMQPIQPGDLLAGRLRHPLVGFSPEMMGVGYYCLETPIREMMGKVDFSSGVRQEIEEMLAFWKGETTEAKIIAAYPEAVVQGVAAVHWREQSGIAFPLYRMAGITLDYEKLLQHGLPGLALLAREKEARTADAQSRALSQGAEVVLNSLSEICERYADGARAQHNPALASCLEAIANRPPENFREAIQLAWLYTIASGTLNYGRMDVYLGPFLARDLDSGKLAETEALELLRFLWRLINDYGNMYNSRVFVGGRGRPDEAAADRFALLAIEATRSVPTNQPQLSLRFYDGQNPALMNAALTCLGEGRTFPILYNDEVNIPAVAAAFGVPRAEAAQYMPYGCGEYTINHASTGTPNGLINLLKALEITLHHGEDLVAGAPRGAEVAERNFSTFEDLWAAYTRRVETALEALALQEAICYRVTGREAPFLLISLLFDDCLERGRGVFDGGARYLGGTVETYGNINTADSLLAIQRLVYQERACTLGKLVAACDANFAGDEDLRQRLREVPKFGNDDDDADAMAIRVHEHVCRAARRLAPKVQLDTYLAVVINNGTNTVLGRTTAASPDGRLFGKPMANAVNPAPGNDRNGVTAFLDSLVKLSPSIHAGTVQNMKFSRSMFAHRRAQLEALLAGYFRSGGTQAMLTVVDRRDLEEAMRQPEKWGHLMVRVGGFSARFVDLPQDMQLEVLRRTLNE